jgi:hypothetical protein
MSKRESLALVVALLYWCLAVNAFACTVPKIGSNASMEELVDHSNNILLVELERKESIHQQIKCTLRAIEVIKGSKPEKLEFYGTSKEHEEATYSNHVNPIFWLMDIGRSEWPCCICGPDHTFEKGFQYLYFPDLLGARKSAEIVRTKDDRWYKYVIERVANNNAHTSSSSSFAALTGTLRSDAAPRPLAGRYV